MNKHFRRLQQGIHITFPTDPDGHTGRQCPNPNCNGYFLIKTGTGLTGEKLPCHCPYCGFTSAQGDFNTPEQLEYAKSYLAREFQRAVGEFAKDLDRRLQIQTRGGFVQLRMDYKHSPHTIRYYAEKQVETRVTCANCTLEYKVYGLFAFCPDCGVHNSMQILEKNLDLALRQLSMAEQDPDPDFATYLLNNTLEDCVSAFDGFGRAACTAYASTTPSPQKAASVSFQNLAVADDVLAAQFGFRLSTALPAKDWQAVLRAFQKRHLFAHKLGVIDDEYIQKTADPQAIRGRLVTVSSAEITELIAHLRVLGRHLMSNLAP